MARASAYLDALHLLARRELTVAECRARLVEREHSETDIDRAVAHLLETGGLDDARVAKAHARTAVEIKGRGRLRIQRELTARGIDRGVAAEAVADALGDKDERGLVARAIQKKLRHKPGPVTTAAVTRLYQYLMRQGFTPAVVAAELRKLRRGKESEVE